jgi:hypothetical protein
LQSPDGRDSGAFDGVEYCGLVRAAGINWNDCGVPL